MTSLFHSPDNSFLDEVRADKCFTLKVIEALSHAADVQPFTLPNRDVGAPLR